MAVESSEQAGDDLGAQPGEEVPEFDADWGLETLVNVGEHWIDSLLQVLRYSCRVNFSCRFEDRIERCSHSQKCAAGMQAGS